MPPAFCIAFLSRRREVNAYRLGVYLVPVTPVFRVLDGGFRDDQFVRFVVDSIQTEIFRFCSLRHGDEQVDGGVVNYNRAPIRNIRAFRRRAIVFRLVMLREYEAERVNLWKSIPFSAT